MRYFLSGIKGSGMSSLACILKNNNNYVTGCDDDKDYTFTQKILENNKIKIYNDDKKLNKNMIYIYSSAINKNHYSYKKAKKLNLKMYEYYEFIGELTKQYKTICISGTHGKTTTCSMIFNILNNTIGTSAIIGNGVGYINKDSNNLLLESCEYKKHFLQYNPTDILITNIDYDHADCYKNIKDIIQTFQKFINKATGNIIICGDDKDTKKLKNKNIVYYGFNKNNNFICKNIIQNKNSTNFDVYKDNNYIDTFTINLIGNHNIQNALGTITLSYLKGIDTKEIKNALLNYQTATRRFNETMIGNNIIIDDYAHHPTEMKSIINMSKIKYPQKEIVIIFIPYTYSRVKTFLKQFTKVLSKVDKVYVTEIEGARESKEDFKNINSELIINKIKNSEKLSENNINILQKHTNSVIIFTGCKDPNKLINLYKKGLEENENKNICSRNATH